MKAYCRSGGEWSASRAGCFTSRGRAPVTHWMGGWVGPRAVLDAVVKRKIPIPCQYHWAILSPKSQLWLYILIWALCTSKWFVCYLTTWYQPPRLYNTKLSPLWNAKRKQGSWFSCAALCSSTVCWLLTGGPCLSSCRSHVSTPSSPHRLHYPKCSSWVALITEIHLMCQMNERKRHNSKHTRNLQIVS
jgi:hypothetical protein